MSSDFYSRDEVVDRGSVPLDIDDVHMLLQGQSASRVDLLRTSICSQTGVDANVGVGQWRRAFIDWLLTVSSVGAFTDWLLTVSSVGAFIDWLLTVSSVGAFTDWLLTVSSVGAFIDWLLTVSSVGAFIDWLLTVSSVGAFIDWLLTVSSVGAFTDWLLTVSSVGAFTDWLLTVSSVGAFTDWLLTVSSVRAFTDWLLTVSSVRAFTDWLLTVSSVRAFVHPLEPSFTVSSVGAFTDWLLTYRALEPSFTVSSVGAFVHRIERWSLRSPYRAFDLASTHEDPPSPSTVEQEQIQKKTFTNWVNAQLAKRRPPCMILDLFQDFRDGSRLLDLLEVMSGQRLSRERGRGMFQHRSNIEKALSFLKAKSIKLVNINIPDIIDGKPSIILGLIWTIILQYHIEELASSLSFSSRQSSMESLASLDSRSTLSSRSASSSPVPPRGSPLHRRFRVSAKKALLLWVREQCHRAGCTLNVKDFKTSWRSGVVFLAILYALRPDVVDLSKARTRSNRQNLEEAFRVAESELRIPKLLDPDDVDVRDPDEKSIMTYVAQFLQYSKDLPVAEEDVQASPDQKVKEVTCWLLQALDELLEGWDSTEGESYAERYHVFHTFVVSFSEQRRSIIPLLTATRRSPNPSREQRALREAWDALAEKLRDYRIQLDTSLPAPLDAVAGWLLKTEGALGEEETEPQDHGRAADDAKEKQELLKVCLEEMPQHLKTFQSFQNTDHDGNMMVPSNKLDELKRRFTSVRVSAKYHGIKLEYRELRHTALDLLGQIRSKLQVWKRPYITPEAVRVLLQEWHECVNTRQLPSMLEVNPS
ncbi:hypothetical protein fugu_016806 [Takifugu bimaculatus]|uniref:Calponin-homology (CH) domain-containing protein n=1 Tax=Takifugu bimaculatus TaxID=433685 RepID=A0A4Z2BU19_9TELE|nr:hypothetical protein fugu_016806 [Takifugu bimaculatus]